MEIQLRIHAAGAVGVGKTYKDSKDFVKINKLKNKGRPKKIKGRKKTTLKQEINEQMIENGLYGI